MKPLKRHKALQPLSREHHHGLLLCWKIRAGIQKKVATTRIQTYADWFFETHLIPHFEIEEAHIFSLLNKNHEGVQQALTDHNHIKNLFSETAKTTETLQIIEETIVKHIRFEERILFPEIQKVATEAQLLQIEKIHQPEAFEDNLHDEFWK